MDTDVDAYSYLLGSQNVARQKIRNAAKQVLLGTNEKSELKDRPPNINRTIALPEVSRILATLHISLISDFLDGIKFAVYLQKNWRHPCSLEMTGDFATRCLVLPKTPSGRQYPYHTKIWVVTLVCKGTSACSSSPHHGETSPRRFCGFGMRLYSQRAYPSLVVIEEFGTHNLNDNSPGWKFIPPKDEGVNLPPSMVIEAYRYRQTMSFL